MDYHPAPFTKCPRIRARPAAKREKCREIAPYRAFARKKGRLRGQAKDWLCLLRSPGYLAALAVLAALSIYKTIGG